MRPFVGYALCLFLTACGGSPRGKPWSVTHHQDSQTVSLLPPKTKSSVYQKLDKAIQTLKPNGDLYADITCGPKFRGSESLTALKGFLINAKIPEDHLKTISCSKENGRMAPLSLTLKTYRLDRVKCPGFGDRMDSNNSRESERNFNCSITANDVAMIANPRAYVEGRSLRGGDGIYHSRVVDQYQQGKTKELKIEKVTSSDAG